MIPLPSQPKIIKKEKNKAIFQIEALYPGYGVTIGNSLRRVLLSSLPGAAVTQMKIKGAPHEFSTISGIIEDMIIVMLNIKQLRFKLYNDEPQKAILKIKGEKEVKGSDFQISTQAELVNKNCHIATLTAKSSELEIEIQIEKGIGYSSREVMKKIIAGGKEKLGIGMIPLDAIFTPVKRVSYYVESMRVGERTDFDRLFLEIETDGTITPETALSEASGILLNHFSLFVEDFISTKTVDTKKKSKKKEVSNQEQKIEKKLKVKISTKKTIPAKKKLLLARVPKKRSAEVNTERLLTKKTKKMKKTKPSS